MKTTKLTAEQAQQIEEAFENAESVAASINAGKHHVIQIDDEKCFWQREEWVRWAIDEVLPEIREALSAIRAARAQEQAEQEPVSLHKVVEEHIADLRACVPTLRQYPEMASMTREVIKAANELEAALKSEQAEQESDILSKSLKRIQSLERQLKIAQQQWDNSREYALELAERLFKYEGGSPMLLNSEQAEQEPFDMDDHPPHRLCECRKCMEYFTPLPDCDVFAAFGKPIAEQEPGEWINEDELPEFYPYDDMYQSSKVINGVRMFPNVKVSDRSMFYALTKDHTWISVTETQFNKLKPECRMKCYIAPVRTKDLTNEDKLALWKKWNMTAAQIDAVIAAYKEKNNA